MSPQAGSASGGEVEVARLHTRARPCKAYWPSVLDEKVTKECNIPGVRER